MNKRPENPGRRQAIKLVIGGTAAIPLGGLLLSRTATAADLPHLAEDDPLAVSLKYRHDATQAPRVE
jgi:hypothetical protein